MIMSWINLYPDWYITERQNVETHYPQFWVHEKALETGTLLYFGELVFRPSSGAIKQPVMMIYPSSFPFRPPIVIPIDVLPKIGASGKVSNKFKTRMFDQRHQMQDGSLCLFQLETRLIPGGDIIRGIDILRRAQQWLLGFHTNHWPPDSLQSELESHFKYVSNVLLGEVFYTKDLNGYGRFCLIPDLRRVVDSGRPEEIPAMIVTVVSEESSVAKVFNASEDLSRVYPWIQDNIWGSGAFAEIESGNLGEITKHMQVGYWWSLPEEPLPFHNGKGFLRELAKVTPKGESWPVVSKTLGAQLTLSESHFLGLKYPGRETEVEWLMLWIYRGERKTPPVIKTEKEKQKEFEEAPVFCLRTHSVRPTHLRFRNTGVIDDAIEKKTVALIGLGALGSNVAELLAKAGVGKIRICDGDRLSIGNIARHVGGVDEFGALKTRVVMRRLLEINPFLKFEEEDVISGSAVGSLEKLSEFIQPADIIISTVADEGIESVINQIGVINRKTVIYGRAVRRGSMGRVFLVRPHIDACKSCLSEYHKSELDGDPIPKDWIKIEERPEDILLHECGRPVIAGSAVDLSFISNLISRISLDILEGTEHTDNHWIWSRTPEPAVDDRLNVPMGIFAGKIEPNPNCPACREPEVISLVLDEEVKSMIVATTEAFPEVETGGILIGFEDECRRAIVIKATGPGPKAVHKMDRFERDVEFIQKELEESASKFGKRGLYLGEWHSHLNPNPQPSPLDLTSLFGISEALNYLIRSPTMVIVGLNPSDKKVANIQSWNIMMGGRSYLLEVETMTSEDISNLEMKKL